MTTLHFVLNCPSRDESVRELLEIIEKIDPQAPIKKTWDSVIDCLELLRLDTPVVLIDIIGRDGRVGLERLQEIWKLRVAHNYAEGPIYFALSCAPQAASLRYEIRRMGGRFMYLSDVASHFISELDEIKVQVKEIRESAPCWEISEEYFGADPRRVEVAVRFGSNPIYIGGSDRHRATLAVLIQNNGIARSLRALRQLCEESPLFTPSGGPFPVPQPGTMKVWLYRDYPKYLQRAFDQARSGFRAERVIEHVDLGAKAIGFRIRGRSTIRTR